MLVFNEGIPRSGKSYDVIKNHILPALASGRRVFARLNGLEEPSKRQVIADHLKMSMERLDELLIHVKPADVLTTFVAERGDDGGWRIPAQLCNSLSVVDECHGFWVASTQPIPARYEEFFALIGQYGGDGVLMTQFYKRLHSSVRGRIERKNVFQKLTAVGLEGKYTVQRYHAVAPERFEKVTTDTETYDPVIFPMYRGYAADDSNKVVYKGGGQTVWRKIAKYAMFVVPVVFLAVWQLASFFGSDSGLVKHASPAKPVASVAAPSGSVAYRETAGAHREAVPVQSHSKMTDAQSYVFDLVNKGRPRLAGLITMQGLPAAGVIEWRQGDTVADRLDLAQVRDLGVTVEVHRYGVRLVVGKDSQVVTAWPLDLPASTQASPSSSEGQGRAVASTASPEGTAWHEREVSRDYTPPELVKGPGMSSYSMH